MKFYAPLEKASIFAICLAIGSIAASGAAAPVPAAKVPGPKVSPTPTPTPEEVKIPGTVIPRKNGGFLGVTLEGGDFKMSFFDEHKQPIAPTVPRATARWKAKQKFGEDRAILNPTADGQALKGNHFVQPPFPVRATFTLLNAEGSAVEIYPVNFKP